VIIGAFALIAYRLPKSAEDATEVSELDELLNLNIAANYPSTPREVMKQYDRYMLCLYGTNGGELTSDQVQELGKKMREFYDQELLESNTEDANLAQLSQELATFQKDNKVMIRANVSDSNDVEYIDVEGGSGALVEVSYFIRKGSGDFTRTYQQYLLRKDDAGNWKILGFEKVDEGES
jgi:hypothetical protein